MIPANYIIYAAPAFIALAAAALTVVLVRRIRVQVTPNTGVTSVLERAVELRCPMLIKFSNPTMNGDCLLGPCIRFDSAGMFMDVSTPLDNSYYEGEPVLTHFKIDGKYPTAFYQFSSVLRGSAHQNGRYGVILDMPSAIDSGQRRNFVRVVPRHGAVRSFAVWAPGPYLYRPHLPSMLGDPIMSRCDGAAAVGGESLSLDNVSAAGLRLVLRYKNESLACEIVPGERLICFLSLALDGETDFIPIWLECTVMNRQDGESGEVIALGLKFNAWAVSRQDAQDIPWSVTSEDGYVNQLNSWVWQQQLQQRRTCQ